MIIQKGIGKANRLQYLLYRFSNYYETLEVDFGASQQEIKNKYYELAKKYHPDSNNHKINADKFIKIKEAYETLSS